MAIIPFSQLSLSRERKLLTEAFVSCDWSAVQKLDSSLMQSVDRAAEDPARDMGILLRELKEVVSLYRELLARCDVQVEQVVRRS